MTAEIPFSDSEVAVILLCAFFGLAFGFSIGTTIAQKFSKYKIRYNFVKVFFPTCFGLLVFFNIVNFSSIEDEQPELNWPENMNQAVLLATQSLTNYNPFLLLQIPLMAVIFGIIRMSRPIQEDGKSGFKFILIFSVASIIFWLTSVEPLRIIIGMYTAFQLVSIAGIYIGIKNTSNTDLFTWIIRWLFGKNLHQAS